MQVTVLSLVWYFMSYCNCKVHQAYLLFLVGCVSCFSAGFTGRKDEVLVLWVFCLSAQGRRVTGSSNSALCNMKWRHYTTQKVKVSASFLPLSIHINTLELNICCEGMCVYFSFYNFIQTWGRSNRRGELDTYNRSSTLSEVNEKNNRQLIYRRRRKVVKVNMCGFPVFRPRKRGSRRTARLPLVSCTISTWFMFPLVQVGVFKTRRSVVGFC